MHYAIVSQNPPVQMPNGLPYENTELCWDKLNNASRFARYLEYVDPAAFVDRQNGDPIIHLDYSEPEAYTTITNRWNDYKAHFVLPEFPNLPGYSLDSFIAPQRYHMEVWCEKSTMNDIIVPLIKDYHGAFLYGSGELSITAALAAIGRFRKSGKPVRIFYVSDFDPDGANMPKSMSRKVEYFISNLSLDMDVVNVKSKAALP